MALDHSGYLLFSIPFLRVQFLHIHTSFSHLASFPLNQICLHNYIFCGTCGYSLQFPSMKVQLLLHKKWKYELLSAKILSVIAAFPKLSRGKRRLWCHLFNFWALRLLKFFVISTHPPGFKQSLIKSLRETFYNQKTRSYSKNTWNTNKDDRWMMDNFKDTVKNLTMSPTPQTWDRVRHEGNDQAAEREKKNMYLTDFSL